MPALAGLVYLLLSLPVTLRLQVCLNGMKCWSEASAFALGAGLRFDARVLWRGALRIQPRYGKKEDAPQEDEPPALPPGVLRTLGRMARWDVSALVGLGDAAQTAMSVGTLRAGLCAALAGLSLRGSVRVGADFQAQRFLLTARCIIHAPLGDIVFSAARAAIDEGRRRIRHERQRRRFRKSHEACNFEARPVKI